MKQSQLVVDPHTGKISLARTLNNRHPSSQYATELARRDRQIHQLT